MGKNLFISASILLLLGGLIFLAALTVGVVVAQIDPVQVIQPESLMPVQQDKLPGIANLKAFSAETSAELSQLEKDVIAIRHLMPDETIYRNTLNAAELRERVMTDFFADYSDEDIKRDTTLYALMGVVKPDFDLYNFFVDLYSEQIAGFYDDISKEMVVVQDESFGGPERMTYAHEFTHLLQDQNYNLEDGLNLSQELLDDNMDGYYARQALVEGDATMTEYLWYQTFATPDDNVEVQQFAVELNTPVYDSAPAFMKNELMFPYQYGLEFVHTIYVDQGWQGIANLYQNPPQSTEQILHPERYPQDTPISVSLDALTQAMPDNWQKLSDSTFGEEYLYLLLLNDQDLQTADVSTIWNAVKGWGGDQYQLYMDDQDNVVFVLHTAWDTAADAQEFADAFLTYGKARWNTLTEGSDASFTAVDPYYSQVNFIHQNDQTWWIFTPQSMSQTVLDALQVTGD